LPVVSQQNYLIIWKKAVILQRKSIMILAGKIPFNSWDAVPRIGLDFQI